MSDKNLKAINLHRKIYANFINNTVYSQISICIHKYVYLPRTHYYKI